VDILDIIQLDGERGLRLVGELDMQSAPQLLEARTTLQGDGRARLDLEEVTFIDSHGLHALVAFARAENGNGRVILDNVSETMNHLFEITDLAEHPRLEIKLRRNGD